MPFDPEATGIIPRLDLDAAQSPPGKPHPDEKPAPDEPSAADRPTDTADTADASDTADTADDGQDADDVADSTGDGQGADDAGDAIGAGRDATGAGQDAADSTGEVRDAEDSSQTMTFRVLDLPEAAPAPESAKPRPAAEEPASTPEDADESKRPEKDRAVRPKADTQQDDAEDATEPGTDAEKTRPAPEDEAEPAPPKAKAPQDDPEDSDESGTATLPKVTLRPVAEPVEDSSATTPFPIQQARKGTDTPAKTDGKPATTATKTHDKPAPSAETGGKPAAPAQTGGESVSAAGAEGRAGGGGATALRREVKAPEAVPGEAPEAVPGEMPEAVPGEAPEKGQPGAEPAARPQVRGPGGRPAGLWARLLVSAPKWLPVLLVLEGLVMYVLAVKAPPGPYWGVDPDDINGLGLISALPVTAFAAILIMIVSFFVTVAQSTDRKFLLLFQIAAITFALHGVGALVAEEPRFPTAYIHAGFVEFIGRTGETAINIDARMGWPGFFALFAFVTKAAGIEDLTPILNWSPLLSNLLYLLPFVLILRQVVATTRARWFAALLFILVQWIGQDYFSPQGFTFALYLAFVAILLRWFGRVEPRTRPIPAKGLRRLLGRLDAMTPGELANTGMYRADKLLMLMLLLALFVASTASHQITPFMMLGVVTAFLLFKRTSLTWALPFSLGLVVLTWISYMAVGFWVGQIGTIFGGLGRVFDNLQTNTGARIEGSDPLHALVLQARLGILVVILTLAAVGLYRRLHRGVFDRAALILLCVPALALAMQSYGGEMGLRIYMFALPGACLLAAYAFFPNMPADSADVREETVPLRKRNVRFNPDLTRKVSLVLAACIAVGLAGAFLVARYGNEKFERVTSGEVAAMHYVYEHDKPSARVVYLVPKLGPEVTPTLPWGERDIELVNFAGQALVYKDPSNISGVIERLRPGPESPRNTYVVVSRGQVSYLQLNEGFPEGWGERFRAALDAAPELKRVYANEDAALYTWGSFVRGTEIPEPRPYKGPGDPTSPWTPVGVAALAVAWICLLSYEVIRLGGPRRAPRARRWLLWVGVPAFVAALGVIVERFVHIAGL
ncbi:hypothetical protein OUY22_25260 [Nonomuraea sp. MCN248]|uniref:Uncharacterized protein n=1 Tax=Nonomuraea corallina TaxID=2989783 RepID=A0ABT4SIH5_9ACTN|nr:hypothetical protein [Nonomuraea corallina]MDA0636731.1 hypothetical protein [Nonomuraea corallina]